MRAAGESGSAGRGRLYALALGLLLHLGLAGAALASGDDRTAAVAAAASLGVAIVATTRWIGLRALSPPAVYLYVFGVFHLGLVVPWALGAASRAAPPWMIERRLSPALLLVILALAAFQIGVSLGAGKSGPRKRLRLRLPLRRAPSDAVMFHCGLVLVAIGLAALAWGVRQLGFDRLINATYFETYQLARTYDPRFFVTSLQVVPMGLYLAAAAAPRKRIWTVGALGLGWAAAIFIIGYRGFALVPIATLAVVFDRRGVRIPRAVWAGALALLVLAIPAVRAMRDNPLARRSAADLVVSAHPLEAVEEMGGSLRPLVHTIELMENETLRWGKTYWQAVLQVVPNLAFEWGGERYLPLEELPPSHWVSRLAAPWHYRHYGGLGFSAVAEPYMNFGVAGVAAWFMLLGWALARADRSRASETVRLAAAAMALGPLLWTTRNAMTVFFRPAVWGLAVVAVSALLGRTLTADRRRRLPPSRARRFSPGFAR